MNRRHLLTFNRNRYYWPAGAGLFSSTRRDLGPPQTSNRTVNYGQFSSFSSATSTSIPVCFTFNQTDFPRSTARFVPEKRNENEYTNLRVGVAGDYIFTSPKTCRTNFVRCWRVFVMFALERQYTHILYVYIMYKKITVNTMPDDRDKWKIVKTVFVNLNYFISFRPRARTVVVLARAILQPIPTAASNTPTTRGVRIRLYRCAFARTVVTNRIHQYRKPARLTRPGGAEGFLRSSPESFRFVYIY